MLELDNVAVTVEDFTLTVDLRLERGARLALLGASGSGKSTFLSLVAGFHWPDRGRVVVDGRNLSRAPVAARPLSILFQDGNLFPHLTVYQNVALGLRTNLALQEAERAEVELALARVGLAGFDSRRPAALSGGQQGRVALARMLVRARPLVLLDEPFSALDPGLRAEMLALMRELCEARGLTLVMASHELRDAERLCDRLCLLEAGSVAVDGPMDAVLANPPEVLRPWM